MGDNSICLPELWIKMDNIFLQFFFKIHLQIKKKLLLLQIIESYVHESLFLFYSRAMSSLRKGAPPSRMKKKSPDPVISNGNSNPSLYYPNDPPDDENMNEIADENVDLTVLLPEGKVKDTSVNSK